ncbi:hypothetical protein D3C80_2221030 [compost metagenome]
MAISSWAINRVGALACALLIITGQLTGGVTLDALAGRLGWDDLFGVALVLAGAGLQRLASGRKNHR